MYGRALASLAYYSDEIAKIDKMIASLPPEKFYVSGKGMYTNWYVVDSGKRRYLPKENEVEASQRAYRKYLYDKRTAFEQEIRALQRYLEEHESAFAL